MIKGLFRPFFICLLSSLPALPQSYQTSFNEVKFDRATAVRVRHGGPTVDPATGALELQLPLGPGIGAKGAEFRPTFAFRLSPRAELKGTGGTGFSPSTGGLEGGVHPGYFDLGIGDNRGATGYRVMGAQRGSSRGRLQGIAAGPALTAFGYAGASVYWAEAGDNDDLILACSGANGEGMLSLPSWVGKDSAGNTLAECQPVPPRLLVMASHGDVVYEFRYAHAIYPKDPIWPHSCGADAPLPFALVGSDASPAAGHAVGQAGREPHLAIGGNDANGFGENPLKMARYLLVRIANRFAEEIRLDWQPDGVGWSAASWRNGQPTGISMSLSLVSFTPAAAGIPVINNLGGNALSQAHLRLIYEGVDQGAVDLHGVPAGANQTSYGPAFYNPWGYLLENFQPTGIEFPASSEHFDFSYTSNSLPSLVTATRTYAFEWTAYSFPRNRTPGDWNGFKVFGDCPLSTHRGVTKVTELDPMEPGAPRVTRYFRTVPVFQGVGAGSESDGFLPIWSDSHFHCAVQAPDGSVTLHRYVPPVPGSSGDRTTTQQAQMQTLAHLRHIRLEERHYDPGQDWASDVDCPAEASIAYHIVRWGKGAFAPGIFFGQDQDWSMRALQNRNPAGTITVSPQLYPLLRESWRREATAAGGSLTIYTSDRTADWDPEGLGWKTKSQSLVADPARSFASTQTTRFDTDWVNWLLSRQVATTTRVTQDSLEGRDKDVALPPEETQSTTFKIGTNLPDTQGRAVGTSSLTASYPVYEAGRPKTVTLTGSEGTQPLNLSGSVGIDTFGYDANGFLALIQPRGVGWAVQQSQDGLGRPLAQVDEGGRITSFGYDAAGRLVSIAPPGEMATSISYPDLRTAVVTWGIQQTTLVYNGFGELVLERRWNDGAVSHRRWGYDTMGRKAWETVWAASQGIPDGWSNADSPLDQTKGQWVDSDVCTKWLKDPSTGEYECVAYQKIWVVESIPAHHWAFDDRGRLLSEVDAAKVSRTFSYDGLDKIATDAAGSTRYRYDAKGRLHEVLDALNQKTQYRFDAKDRITRVTQFDAAMNAQVRTWSYHPLGWVQSLDQPESGVTTYARFDVNGKPWSTNYNGRLLSKSFDAQGHLTSLAAADGSVSQVLTWGTAPDRFANKLISATSPNGVKRTMDYASTTGRLIALTREVDGLTFGQTMGYDAYGLLARRTYPDGRVQVLHHQESTGLPDYVDWNGARLANLHFDSVSWNMDRLAFAGALGAASTTLTYGPDQGRLATMRHEISGMMPAKTWSYSYDGAGRLLSDGEDSYTYDPLGRLVTAAVADPWGSQGLFQTFGYDAFGNRILTKTETASNWTPPGALPNPVIPSSGLRAGLEGVTANVAFTAGGTELRRNRLPAYTSLGVGTGAVYDAQGNLTQVYPQAGAVGAPINLAYDTLARVVGLSFGPNATRKSESYLYDDEGLRIRIWDGTKYRYNIYNEARQLAAQYERTRNADNTWSLTWKKDIVYLGTKELAEADGAGLAITLVDHLGSPRFAWRGGTGAVLKQKFLPFGEPLTDPTSAAKFAKGFTNHEQTDPSGLIYMQARFYAPWYGRFLSPDPARDQHFEVTQSWNIYSYVRNQPTMAIDPDGMEHYWVVVNQSDPKRMAKVYVTRNDGSLRATYDARAMGSVSKGHRRDVKDGDTPYGTARAGRIMVGKSTMEKTYGKEKAKAYGEAKINLEAISGELKTTGRATAGVAVHGGGTPLGDHAFDAQQSLLNTQGCIRMHNEDVSTEARQIQANQAKGESATFHVGTVDSLQNEAKKLNANVPGVNSVQQKGLFAKALDKLKTLF